MLQLLNGLGGGAGGFSPSSSSSSGPIGGSTFNNGGLTVNKGVPTWVFVGGFALLSIGALLLIRRGK